jgi:hypothetical protein
LTPNLQSNPVQVDLLGPANQCFLAQLGSTGIPPGTYPQIRILLNSSTLLVTIPSAAQSLSTATLSTAAGAGCPGNTDCADCTLAVPAANPAVGAFMSGANQSPALPVAGSANYTIDAVAFVPGSAGELDCSLSELHTTQTSTNTTLTVTSGASVTASTRAFTGCK